MIFDAFGRALAQLSDPRFRRVLLLGVGCSFAALLALTLGVAWGIGWAFADGIWLPFVGQITWAGNVLSVASLGLMLLASAFLMVPIAQAVQSLFLDQVADAVEAHHYPSAPAPRHMPLGDAVADALRAMGVLVLANLGALVLYVLFPPLAPVIFLALNGFLLGREYFLVVAQRHMPAAEARALGRRHLGLVWLAGALMAAPLTVPVVNLAIPVIGAATFTHLFHRVAPRSGSMRP